MTKLDIIKDSENCVDAFGDTHNVAGHNVINKVNEIIDVLNALIEMVNVHEREIDKLQMARIPAITNDYTVIKYDELCRLREAADELARLKGLKGF